MMTDPLADMLTRIRNGQRARKTSVMTPASKLRGSVLDVLEREGYIRGYAAAESDTGKPAFSIELKYHEGRPVIAELKRIIEAGPPGLFGIKDLPRYYAGLGISILSTPRGVLSENEARNQNVGGEVLCRVF